jgi:hypothetical protein
LASAYEAVSKIDAKTFGDLGTQEAKGLLGKVFDVFQQAASPDIPGDVASDEEADRP